MRRIHKLPTLKLYQQIMLLVFFLLLLVFSLNVFFTREHIGDILNSRRGNSSGIIADTISTSAPVITALTHDPIDRETVEEVVKTISQATKASIIVFDSQENIVTISNPNMDNAPSSNGTTPNNLLALKELPQNMFNSQNAKPIVKNGLTYGYVLVGFPNSNSDALMNFFTNILIVACTLGLTIGLIGSLILAYIIKKNMFGLEPLEIAHLLKERNILLDTVNESIFFTDDNLQLKLVNSKAQKLLEKTGKQIDSQPINYSFAELGETQLLQKVLETGESLHNIDLTLNGLATIGDIILLKYGNSITGLLISVNEKDTVQAMAERLSGVTNYANALRARTHEFMNKMHVVKGLVFTKNYEQLQEYVETITESELNESKDIQDRIKQPLLASFLLAKKSRAYELQVDFSISEESNLPAILPSSITVHDLIVIIGNLLENGFDVLREKKTDRNLLLEILSYENELVIIVSNNGAAIPQSELAKIFEKGYTTKGKGHGYGLALLKERVDKLHGTINVDSDDLNGTEFAIEIPLEGE